MHSSERIELIHQLREVFGTHTDGIDIESLELSDEVNTINGKLKQRLFDKDRAMQLVDRFDPSQLTDATILISTHPIAPSLEKFAQDRLCMPEETRKMRKIPSNQNHPSALQKVSVTLMVNSLLS